MVFALQHAIYELSIPWIPKDTLLDQICNPFRTEKRIATLDALLKEPPGDTTINQGIDLLFELLHERLTKQHVESILPLSRQLKEKSRDIRSGHKKAAIINSLHISFIALYENSRYFAVLPKRIGKKARLFEVLTKESISDGLVYECVNSIVYFFDDNGLCLKESKTRSDKIIMREFVVGRLASCPLLKAHTLHITPKNTLGLLSECMKGNDLSIHYSLHGMKKKEILTFAKRALRSLMHLHKNNLVHGDVKPENFFGTPKTCVLGDHDSVIPKGERAISGTHPFMAPEMFTALGRRRPIPVTPSMDIWSFGVTLYEFLGNPQPKLSELRANGYKTLINAHATFQEPFASLLKGSLNIREIDRLSAKELLALLK